MDIENDLEQEQSSTEQQKDPKNKKQKKPFTSSPWFLYGVISIALSILLLTAAVLFDRVIMPQYVGLYETSRVPNIEALHVNVAMQKLESLGFHPIIQGEFYQPDVPKNHVFRQRPVPNALVKKNRNIYLTLSKGIRKREMPELEGMDLQEVTVMLMRRGLELGEINYAFDSTKPALTVFEQSIEPFEEVENGQKVDIKVSLGVEKSFVELPDLKGLPLFEAESRLYELDLTLGQISYEDGTFLEGDIVIDQSPTALQNVAVGTPINITVSR